MMPHRLRRSFKFSERPVIDVVFAAAALAIIAGLGALTVHPHPNGKLVVQAPIALQGSVKH